MIKNKLYWVHPKLDYFLYVGIGMIAYQIYEFDQYKNYQNYLKSHPEEAKFNLRRPTLWELIQRKYYRTFPQDSSNSSNSNENQ